MKDSCAFSTGLNNINNARFIRANFIPRAIENKRWTLAVYEIHRVAELLLAGTITLLGGDPYQRRHNLEGLVQKFQICLEETKGNLPFSIGYYTDNGDCYGTEWRKASITLFQRVHGVYTALCSARRPSLPDNIAPEIGLELDESSNIILSMDGKVIAQTRGFSSPNRAMVCIRRNFILKPPAQRFSELKKMSESFTHDLLKDARYSRREFEEAEALEMQSRLDRIFEISENLISVGK